MDWTRFAIDGQHTPWVAVSIERTPHCNLHVGLVYRDADNRVHRLHFAWHNLLVTVPYVEQIASAVPPLDWADAMWMSKVCAQIAQQAPRNNIPYNLKYDEDVAFDTQTGEIIFGVESTGLGCATFVAAVFRSSGNRLIDMVDWPAADIVDRTTQQRFVNALLRDPDPEKRAQGERIRGEIGTKRIRPEHAAGACLETELPVRHPQCHANGERIVAAIDVAAQHRVLAEAGQAPIAQLPSTLPSEGASGGDAPAAPPVP